MAYEAQALEEMEQTWAPGGYHGFDVGPDGRWSAISSAGDVLIEPSADELARVIREHWQNRQ